MILPSVCVPDCGAAILYARQLCAFFQMCGMNAAVCCDRRSHVTGAGFYESPSPSLRLRKANGTTFEDYHYSHNVLTASYLKQDLKQIEKAFSEYEPDLLIEIERPAALIAAARSGIPVFSIVSPSAFRNRDFRASTLNGLNVFLRSAGMEQVIHLRDLYQIAECFAFGPQSFLPSFHGYPVSSFGLSCVMPPETPPDRTLSMMFTEYRIPARKMKQIITEAFRGAPYEVFIYDSRQTPGKTDNLRFQNTVRTITMNGSRTCIHDGTDVLTQYCTALGIPQIIIHDDSYQRSWNAACLRRSGAGLTVPEAELSMERLYEAYRQVLADDRYAENALRLKENILERGDIRNMLAYISY